ncbi:MAG: hypothetical protein FMNOHCHN_03794 [Ignavibacteriaceae bacterium]|nr:hypothetical protein [Ignavibacteriaceae bacterium]
MKTSFIFIISILLTKLANAEPIDKMIVRLALEYRLSPQLMLSIAKVESSMSPLAYNAKTRDYGLFQINYKTAKSMNLDISRLYEPEYNARAAMQIMKYMQGRFKHEQDWFCRYNVGTRSYRIVRRACIKYARAVYKYYTPEYILVRDE